MQSVLSYFKSYFDPDGAAPLANHSAGQIARHLHEALQQLGSVRYFGSKQRPEGLSADLCVGHFWSFADFCRPNDFKIKVAFYSVSDPAKTRRLLRLLAKRFDVPEPLWDLPPPSFDHRATLEMADIIFVVGNAYTLETFPKRWRHKITLLNYSVDIDLYSRDTGQTRRNEFCYVATHCGLRKGFMDILNTWRDIDADETRLHAIGQLDAPWDALLRQRDNGSIIYHGWIDSNNDEYLKIIKSCRFAHIPTYSEGQMGTLLEAIFSGCVPITTRASGIDDNVLKHCVVIEPLNIEQQQKAIRDALSWSDDQYNRRQREMLRAAREHHNWQAFKDRVLSAIRRFEQSRRA